MELQELITSEELAKRLKIQRITLYRWVKKGVPRVPVGTKQYRYDYKAVLDWLHNGGAKK
jgi:excisionase family DNA binding protein